MFPNAKSNVIQSVSTSLPSQNFAVFKGKITEWIVEKYVTITVVPRLKESGWDHIIYNPRPWSNQLWWGDEPGDSIWKNFEAKYLIGHHLCPTPKFLSYFIELQEVLKSRPDGVIFKLNAVGEISVDNALKKCGLEGSRGFESHGVAFDRRDHKKNAMFPLVEGEIEFIEVKSDSARLNPNQKESYPIAIQNGYKLRYFHVEIVSFILNQYRLTETIFMR